MKNKTKWSPVSKEELQAFIGIIIHMGILKLPRIPTCMYWRLQQSVSSIMSETTSKLDLSKEDCGIDKVVSALEMAEDVLPKLDIVLKKK